MSTLKAILSVSTLGCAFALASWEKKIKIQLTQESSTPNPTLIDMGALASIKEQIEREQIISKLPKSMRVRLKVVIALKIACCLGLVLIVLFLR